MKIKFFLATALGTAVGAGCTWVPLSAEGGRVVVRSASEVQTCEKIGNTSAKVLRKVLFVKRSQEAVDHELDTLARNEAATLGGDTVVPTSEESDGKRAYAVYSCGD